jgi:hypothetical protein
MGIRFACHHCGHPLNIKQELAGRVGRCPDCEQRFRIPLQDAPQSLPLNATGGEGTSESPGEMTGRGAARDPVAGDPVARDPVVPTTGATNATQWYVRPPAGGQYGPANDELIQSWIAEYRITPSTLVWRDGWPQWKNASEIFPQLADAAIRSHPLTAHAVSDPVASADRIVAPAADGAAGLIGDAALGKQRSARKRRRIRLVIGLAATVCCLLGALILLWLLR